MKIIAGNNSTLIDWNEWFEVSLLLNRTRTPVFQRLFQRNVTLICSAKKKSCMKIQTLPKFSWSKYLFLTEFKDVVVKLSDTLKSFATNVLSESIRKYSNFSQKMFLSWKEIWQHLEAPTIYFTPLVVATLLHQFWRIHNDLRRPEDGGRALISGESPHRGKINYGVSRFPLVFTAFPTE